MCREVRFRRLGHCGDRILAQVTRYSAAELGLGPGAPDVSAVGFGAMLFLTFVLSWEEIGVTLFITSVDAVTLLDEQNRTREQDLVPVRHGRMMASPFTFYRGAARVMAADLKATPTAGLDAQQQAERQLHQERRCDRQPDMVLRERVLASRIARAGQEQRRRHRERDQDHPSGEADRDVVFQDRLALAQVAQDAHPLQGLDVRVQVAHPHPEVVVVLGEVLRHALGEGGDQHLLSERLAAADLAGGIEHDPHDYRHVALVDDAVLRHNDRLRFVSLQVVCGSKGPQTAELEMEIDGRPRAAKATGNGPVDATFAAISQLFPHEASLQLYQVHAVTQGTDAQAEVTVRLEEAGKTVNGQGADHDTLVASARAYINALNKLLVKREKTAPSVMSA